MRSGHPRQRSPNPGPLFARVVQGLLRPGAYPHPVRRVREIQTHVSAILLAGDFAYKLKKPVRFPFLDMSSLSQRKHLCEEEVRLNRRLSPGLYLGVVPIVESAAGMRVGGEGTPVEYAVRMHRLPEDRMMDRLLRRGELETEAVERLAELIADFHARVESGPAVAVFGSPEAVRLLWDEHFAQTRRFLGRTLSAFQDHLLRATVRAWLIRKDAELRGRVSAGRIRDGHGDLRASSVCFTEPIQVFDCLDFAPRYRCGDVASEVAFLSMDLTLRGAAGLARAFQHRYQERSGDRGMESLLPFYGCYRACVRGKVEGLRAGEREVPRRERAAAERLARRCFAVACHYARQDPPPLVLVTCGLSGTGKSTLAAALAENLGCARISSDVVRKELHHLAPGEHAPAAPGEGLYAEEVTRATYTELVARARRWLATGRSVILDATFQRHWQRALAVELARAQGSLLFFLELRAPDATVRARLRARARDETAVSDADWAVYVSQKAAWEPFHAPAFQHLTIRARGSPESVERDALAALHLRLDPAPPAPRREARS